MLSLPHIGIYAIGALLAVALIAGIAALSPTPPAQPDLSAYADVHARTADPVRWALAEVRR